MSKEANPLAVGMGFQPGKFMKPEPVFSNCNVCGRELMRDDELAVGMCAICANETVEVLTKPKRKTEAHSYAERLAYSIWKQHYKEDSPNWNPLPDMIGVLTQIDNMVTGMHRPATSKEKLAAADPFIRVLKIIDALPRGPSDDRPLQELIPAVWPTLGELRAFVRTALSSSVEAAQSSRSLSGNNKVRCDTGGENQ
jgi:hypothetical protein